MCVRGGGVVTQGEYHYIYRARKEKNEIPKTINVITILRDKGKFEVTAQCLQPIHFLIWDFLYILKDVYRWSGNSV